MLHISRPTVPSFLSVSERLSVGRRVDGQKLMIGIDQRWRGGGVGDRMGVFAKVER